MKQNYHIPHLPLPYDLETKEVLKQVNRANMKLAELNAEARNIPNEDILISSLTLQEAKDSSAVENIVTTHDDLYRSSVITDINIINAATKEILRYRESIMQGYNAVKTKGVLTNNILKSVQQHLEENTAGFRTNPGTILRSSADSSAVYIPPQNAEDITGYMNNLEQFINDPSLSDYDPLIKMAIIHHQFESIHPFYDGNGRTGRILNILYLVYTKRLDMPILYLSRYITHNKAEYYRLIQAVRDKNKDNLQEWIQWIMFMLKGIEEMSDYTLGLVKGIRKLMNEFKNKLRPVFGNRYNHGLINNLFFHPYTKIEFMQRDIMVSRVTAAKYLDRLVAMNLLGKVKYGKENYYMNLPLIRLFLLKGEVPPATPTIESVS